MTDTDPIEELADTLYDALYAITPYAEPHFADEREGLRNAVQAVLTAHAESLNKTAEDTLASIRNRAKAATEGPWERYPEYGPTFFANVTGSHLQGVGDFNFGVGDQAEADETLVRHAHEDIAYLLARVAQMEQQLGRAQAEAYQYRTALQGTARRSADDARGTGDV